MVAELHNNHAPRSAETNIFGRAICPSPFDRDCVSQEFGDL
jgi:hypothetical protein